MFAASETKLFDCVWMGGGGCEVRDTVLEEGKGEDT